eukprot:9280282-Lingulodinium_polyedra.AAC.1
MTSWEAWVVVPTEVVSPARSYCLQGFRLSTGLGICSRATGKAIPVLRHAAQKAFWSIGQAQLQRLCSDIGVEPEDKSAYGLVGALVRYILSDLSEAEIGAILSQRGVPPPELFPRGLSDEVLEDL